MRWWVQREYRSEWTVRPSIAKDLPDAWHTAQLLSNLQSYTLNTRQWHEKYKQDRRLAANEPGLCPLSPGCSTACQWSRTSAYATTAHDTDSNIRLASQFLNTAMQKVQDVSIMRVFVSYRTGTILAPLTKPTCQHVGPTYMLCMCIYMWCSLTHAGGPANPNRLLCKLPLHLELSTSGNSYVL